MICPHRILRSLQPEQHSFVLRLAIALTVGVACLPCSQAGQFQITTNNTRKFAASVAFDGANYLVAIQGDNLFSRANTNSQVAAQLVSQSGTVVTPLIDTGRNTGHGLHYAAFDGTNYLMGWSDSAKIGRASCRERV